MANGKTITINNITYVTDGATGVASSITTPAWNNEYHLGAISSLSVTFPVPYSGISSEIYIVFTANSGFTASFTAPQGYSIEGLDDISYSTGITYEISFKVINDSTISAVYLSSEH